VFLPLTASLIVIYPPFFNFVILPLHFQNEGAENEGAVYPWFLTVRPDPI
jgi:hypothetical protein